MHTPSIGGRKLVVASSLLVAAALLWPAFVQAGPPTEWVHRGIGGGGAMFSPTVNPDNPQELYVACDMTLQFHSTDGGKSWDILPFQQFISNHESAVRFTRDPNVRWALEYASPEGKSICRPKVTRDGGKTWQYPDPQAWPADEDHKGLMLYADYNNPDRVVVAAGWKSLMVTLDGGKSFELKYTAKNNGAGMHLAGAFFDGETIYLGTSDGLLVSKDGGKSFGLDETPGLPEGFMHSFAAGKKDGQVRLYALMRKTGYAGITGADRGNLLGIYVLDVGKGQWQRKDKNLPETAGVVFCKKAQNDIDTCYIAGGALYPRTGPIVYKTTDGGETWTSVFLTEGNKNIIPGWMGDGAQFTWGWPEYAFGLDVSSKSEEHLIISDMGGTHVSDDGGSTWRAVYCTLPADRKMGETKLKDAVYANGGMDPTNLWYVAWFGPKDIYFCPTDIRAIRSTDGGETWSFNFTGHDLNTMFRAVKHPTTNVCYAATSGVHDMYLSTYLMDARIDGGKGLLLSSADDGAKWKTLHDFGAPVLWLALDPTHPKRMYVSVAHSQKGGIYVTEELDKAEGATWVKTAAPPRTEGHPYNINVLNDGSLAVSFSGRRTREGFTPSSGVFHSADGGRTWEDRSDPAMQYWTKDLVIDPHDKSQNTWYAGVAYAWGKTTDAAKKSGLYRTADRGKTWTLLADGSIVPSGILNVESCGINPDNANEMFVTTEYDGLYYCDNLRSDKPAFTPVASYPFVHPLRVCFNPYKKGEVWITSDGHGAMVGQVK
jgi:photosystem II stability/assembly factor-like uncharacterized protein